MPRTDAESVHRPVLRDETMHFLDPGRGGIYVDATLGIGGHSEAILEASPDTRVIGIDQDAEALELARGRLARFRERVGYFHGNFSQIREAIGDARPDGIIADLGVSSLQLDSETRGFSFRFDAPLDMRMNAAAGSRTAADILASEDETAIANIIYIFGEERHSRRIARRIVERRERGEPVETTKQLADLVRGVVKTGPKDKIHPATRTFQALRIAVNNEIDILDRFLADAVDLLKTNGVLAVIAFHSLEDRVVKLAFQRLAGRCSCPPRMPVCQCGAVRRVEILTQRPVTATDAEIEINPRSRSAKLRASRKL